MQRLNAASLSTKTSRSQNLESVTTFLMVKWPAKTFITNMNLVFTRRGFYARFNV